MPWPMRFGPPPSTMIFFPVRRRCLAFPSWWNTCTQCGGRKFGGTQVSTRLGDQAHRSGVGVPRAPPAQSGVARQAAVGKSPSSSRNAGWRRSSRAQRLSPLSGRVCPGRVHSRSPSDLHQEPTIDLGGSTPHRRVMPCRTRRRHTKCCSGPGSPSLSRSRDPGSEFMPSTPTQAQRLWNDSGTCGPMAITSPTDFICVVRVRVGRRELLEREARDLGDDVVDRRPNDAGVAPPVMSLDSCPAYSRRPACRPFLAINPVAFEAKGTTARRGFIRSRSCALPSFKLPEPTLEPLVPTLILQHRDACVVHDLVFLCRSRFAPGPQMLSPVHASMDEVPDRADDDAVVRSSRTTISYSFQPSSDLDQQSPVGGGCFPVRACRWFLNSFRRCRRCR